MRASGSSTSPHASRVGHDDREILRRSQMITPAKSMRIIEKGLSTACDSLILDLEDSIAPKEKGQARSNVARMLAADILPDREIGVRINGLETPWFLDDLLALVDLPIQTLVIPKVSGAQDVLVIDALVRQLERKGLRAGLTLQLMIESARGLIHAHEIALASSRCEALIFGAADFCADTGMSLASPGIQHARASVVVAAATAGVQALDQVYPAFMDDEGLARQAREAKDLGFTGKWAIHPRQVSIINEAFAPTVAEIEEAKHVISSYESALSKGDGAIAISEALVDEASLKIMLRRRMVAMQMGLWA